MILGSMLPIIRLIVRFTKNYLVLFMPSPSNENVMIQSDHSIIQLNDHELILNCFKKRRKVIYYNSWWTNAITRNSIFDWSPVKDNLVCSRKAESNLYSICITTKINWISSNFHSTVRLPQLKIKKNIFKFY